MFLDILWYFTAIFAIWGSSLGGIAVPMLGLLYPFRILAAILAVIIFFKSKKGDWNIGSKTWFTVLPVLLFLLLHSIVSLIWAQDRLKTSRAILNFLYITVFLLLFLRFVKDRKSLNNLLKALSLNFIVILLLAVYEIFSGSYLFRDPAGIDLSLRINAYHVHYPAVCFTNPNDLAFVISLTAPLMLYVADEALKLNRQARLFSKVGIILLTFFVMLNTCSRLGYIDYFIIMAIYLFLQIRKSIAETVLLGVLFTVVLLSVTGIGSLNFNFSSSGRAGSAEMITPISVADTSTATRIVVLEKGLRVTWDTWGLGAGAKNSPALMAGYTGFPQTQYDVNDFHLFYMELLAEYGFIALLMFLCFQLGSLAVAVHILRKQPEHRWLALCSLPGIVGFFPASANCSSCMFVYIMWIQFAIWSMGTSLIAPAFIWKRRKARL